MKKHSNGAMQEHPNGTVPPSTAFVPPGAERSPAPGGTKAAPDPEVAAKAQRRQFTADYKKRVLAEADSALEPGAIGALLRREGLYSSHLTHWRQQRDQGLLPHRRGPKPKHDPLFDEVRQLKLHIGQLTQRLARAELIIDVQKKSRCCWGFRWLRATAAGATHDRRRSVRLRLRPCRRL